MQPVYLSTAYLGPVQQYAKLLQYPVVYIETMENYLKQTYRNRCVMCHCCCQWAVGAFCPHH